MALPFPRPPDCLPTCHSLSFGSVRHRSLVIVHWALVIFLRAAIFSFRERKSTSLKIGLVPNFLPLRGSRCSRSCPDPSPLPRESTGVLPPPPPPAPSPPPRAAWVSPPLPAPRGSKTESGGVGGDVEDGDDDDDAGFRAAISAAAVAGVVLAIAGSAVLSWMAAAGCEAFPVSASVVVVVIVVVVAAAAADGGAAVAVAAAVAGLPDPDPAVVGCGAIPVLSALLLGLKAEIELLPAT